VGPHPVLDELAGNARARRGAAAEIITGGTWDPFRMVDLVEACERGRRPELRQDLLELQELEMLALLSHCYRAAAGGSP
jgi:hypothetical protein